MPPKGKPPQCRICNANEFRYRCSGCRIEYCSVACYKQHKADCQVPIPGPIPGPSAPSMGAPLALDETGTQRDVRRPDAMETSASDLNPNESLSEAAPLLRPLTSLKWPYIPDESAYPDPLKRDDPKALQLHHYEAIATSPSIRRILSSHLNLPNLLKSIDSLSGPDRELALQKALGVTPKDLTDITVNPGGELNEDVSTLRGLAEAIEAAVRGENKSALGLDWGD
ncbi:hypothetical protein BDN72DRAFT_846237 [Pluteus cervinus]|uniref:Uncharacterized protein n=1 Tax=Pluteus cervinus TaxID=181527 RepID=A0ACD3AGF7_9AGAR|nr:hypothetical protein BDN72DRAFT_846237 [Pluteus cervinus]